MLDKIILFSIKNKFIVGLFTAGLVAWGVYSLKKLPIDAVPDITNNQVQIITLSPSLAAQEVERLITFPVEQTMATIPNVKEIRSISRFGLSVVTIVFLDDSDIFWARQQVNERLTQAVSSIPPGVGNPEMAPISTGLGEIYQYVIHAKKGYENKYDAMSLRTIQDWIIRRQLLGTPGVADVSSFGGLLKQYEIALDPEKLRSYDLSIADVFEALQRNNQNTGGAYIDKKPNAYFIRSEGLVKKLDDINKIVVKNTVSGVPVLIRDIADVQFGHANRYGALTRNDEGEAVGAIVLMLKGANSNQVVNSVKARMEQIKKTLPEGVEVEAFLDRSALVGRAIHTVSKNLIEGALIVVFVLVLFLGNLRAGLIVASVIPLAMLFAVSLMNAFGVSGNLMSLGAIDFGLIVDGAVIIVEATMHHLGMSKLNRLNQQEMDDEVYTSASKIRSSAAFGEIIILIVYLPILALVGIEGKMFRPMAQTVSFAILGAFILSLTYVPMMSALVLSKNVKHKRTISDRMMDFFQRRYSPILNGALRRKKMVIATAVLLLGIGVAVFFRLGGEFIPTLEEGDFAIETRLLTGSSLSQTIDKSLQAGKILKEQFPEVKEVIGKIGAGEIPTDPMPIEAVDLMVVLKDKDDWTSAKTREELAEKMAAALSAIPGVTFGFQQPIQMRFNELISGVRQDVGIKIFGDDLETLTGLSAKIGKIVSSTPGAKDLYLEKITGLPEIVVNIDRDQVAKYGLDVLIINQVISTAFAGQSAGLVYEGDQRFDLVLRLAESKRQTLEDVRNLYIPTADGGQVPLDQVAKVELLQGPNQIQREDAKRRIIVGFNVRGRDIASVVQEVQARIETEVKMPTGYFITYGGQFENLREATDRLSIAVPIALALIVLLLFFTFGSIKQSLLIFSAIPMAAIGGIAALLLRGMPFSISAGIGFIALFGVAVLNGIVLIAEFNRLRKEGQTDLEEIVREGTAVRLRPVLMTATVASLGFLPMAISQGSGAEVQKPLATVVIGGLVTSTLLTLVVLPCLYIVIENFKKMKPSTVATSLVIVLMLAFAGNAKAQGPQMTLSQAKLEALKNNALVRSAALDVEAQEALKKTAIDLPKTSAMLLYGQYNSLYTDNNLTITQSIPFPTVFTAQASLNRAMVAGAEFKKATTENELIFQVKQVFHQLLFLKGRHELLLQQDSLFAGFVKSSTLRYETGESTLLEKATAETQQNEVRNQLRLNEADISIFRTQLRTLLQSQTAADAAGNLTELSLPEDFDTTSVTANPALAYYRQQVEIDRSQKKLNVARSLPDFTIGYFNQTLQGFQKVDGQDQFFGTEKRFTGIQAGISIPIWFFPFGARTRASEFTRRSSQAKYERFEVDLQGRLKQAIQEYVKNRNSLAYYKESALPNASLILKQSQTSYQSGEISFAEYLIGLRNVNAIREGYLQTLNQYNQSIISIEFLIGKQ